MSALNQDISQAPLTLIPGVGPVMAEKLKALGFEKVQDLIWHFPHRYEDRSYLTPIDQLQEGRAAVIDGTIHQMTWLPKPKPRAIVQLRDRTGVCFLHFFHVSKPQSQRFAVGQRLLIFGTPTFKKGHFQIAHPECRWMQPHEALVLPNALHPIYPTQQGVSQALLRKAIAWAVSRLTPLLPELLPPSLQKRVPLSVGEAIAWIHAPPAATSAADLAQRNHPAFHRLIWEEFLAHQWALHRRQNQNTFQAPLLKRGQSKKEQFLSTLPFTLTTAQKTVCDEIEADLKKPQPMRRLLQGDVGSGKTVVAAMAVLQIIEQGGQAAIMVPTEVLAEQQYRNFLAWLTPLGFEVRLLIGRVGLKDRTATLKGLASGAVSVVVGTHALFQETVQFRSLSLVVVDEQHRFGVHQRWALMAKGQIGNTIPHQLMMTATPIPRTLTMALYGDMALSIINELPPGRKPIQTLVMPESKRDQLMTRLKDWLAEGRQCYWICPFIEVSEVLQCQAAQKTHEVLQAALPNTPIGLIHGRCKSDQKQAVMAAFLRHEMDILVATTVIEVGIDVPNASLIIIDNAERLGLAQLHQLRGRVGRGSAESICVLLYQSPLSVNAQERLSIIKQTQDGFLIAEKDFALRGPGEWLGTQQTGAALYKIADLQRDHALLAEARAGILSAESWDGEPLVTRWLGQNVQYEGV